MRYEKLIVIRDFKARSHDKLKFANLYWWIQSGVCERAKQLANSCRQIELVSVLANMNAENHAVDFHTG